MREVARGIQGGRPVLGGALVIFMLWMGLPLEAAAQRVGEIKGDHVNVRAQAALRSEVVTQLNEGDRVLILEEVSVESSEKGEPDRWFRIQLPEEVPVWLFASYIDESGRVNVNRLNLRAGPGQNYSILGRIDRGTQVKKTGEQGEWMQIEPPGEGHAFVAAELVNVLEKGAETATLEKEEAPRETVKQGGSVQDLPTDTVIVVDSANATNQPAAQAELGLSGTNQPPVEVVITNTSPEVVQVEKAPGDAVVVAAKEAEAEPVPIPSWETQRALQDLRVKRPGLAEEAAAKQEEVRPRRIVRREGLVRSTFSIQAPTYLELVNPRTRKTMNYLHTKDLDINLREYKGQRIVVTGEEGIDPRWPNTPVIEVEQVELAPE